MPVTEAEPSSARREKEELQKAGQLYSPVAVHIADVMDLSDSLNRLARLEDEQGHAADIDRARRKLTTRLQMAVLEVDSLAAEIECEVHRADEVQDNLRRVQAERQTSQTIAAVVLGGATNIITGGIGLATPVGNAPYIVSITGGVLETLFGTSANFTKVRQEFRHSRNHLGAIWNGSEDRDYFSPGVWRFLTDPDIRDLEGHSLRDMLLKVWREEGWVGEPGSQTEQERTALLFGQGGTYDADELHIREIMLQQLQSSIRLIHQDLETLLREVLIRQAMEDEREEEAMIR